MTPIRALFFLAAITAACAGRIPTTLVEETDSLETHIALLASHRLTGNPIENGIDRFKELVRKIKERLEQAENELIDALEASSVAVVKKINEFIRNRTGVDLKLDEKLEALEKKTEDCTAQFKTSLSDIVVEIKTDTETCAAKQVSDTKEIVEKIVALVEILKVVPAKTIANIKACGAAPTTIAPPTEPTPEDPETDAPETEAPQTVAPETESPETEAPASVTPETESPAIPITEDDSDDEDSTTGDSIIDDSTDSNVVLRSRHSVRSLSDIWKKAKCVTKELATAAKELAEVPDIIAKLVSDIADLSSKESREILEKCAVQSVAGKGTRVQQAAAELAYCVIAPSKQ